MDSEDQAGRAGAGQPGEEQAAGRAWSSCQGLEGLRESWRGAGTRARSDRARGDGFKLKEGRFRLDIRKKFFTLRVVKPWPRLPREAAAPLSLAGLKARLDGALSTPGWWKGSLPVAGGLEQDHL